MEKIDDERFDNGTKLFKSIISEATVITKKSKPSRACAR
jgi:hypothetical protein